MATANTNFGSSCTAKARPKKTLKSTEPTSWPGFRRAAVPGRFSTAIALPHATYLSASQRHHGCGASRLTRVESEMNFFIAASSYHEKRSYSGGLDRLIKQQHQFRKSASTLPKLPSLERALLPLCRGAPTI
ncbi:hypothetical protein ACQRIT_005595 [Beauveria bassiana]